MCSKSEKANIGWYYLHVEAKIWQEWTYLQNRNRLTDIENKLLVTKEREAGNKSRVGINRYKLLYTK